MKWSQNSSVAQFAFNNAFSFKSLEVNINDFSKTSEISRKIKEYKTYFFFQKTIIFELFIQEEPRSKLDHSTICPILLYSTENGSVAKKEEHHSLSIKL